MRIAVLIIGLMLTVGLFVQAMLISGLSSAAKNKDTGNAAAIGVLMALMWLVACGLVLPLPRVSLALFAVSGLFGFLAAGEYQDLIFWGVVAEVLAAFCYFGYRGKRTSDRRTEEQAALVRQATAIMAGQVVPAYVGPAVATRSVVQAVVCPRCNAAVALDARFCPSCGLQRLNPPG